MVVHSRRLFILPAQTSIPILGKNVTFYYFVRATAYCFDIQRHGNNPIPPQSTSYIIPLPMLMYNITLRHLRTKVTHLWQFKPFIKRTC